MRFNQVGTIIGRRGTGKTLFVLGSKYSAVPGDEKLQVPGIIDLSIKNGFKVLFIDSINHPSYKKIPILAPKNFNTFKSGVARVFLRPDLVVKLVNQINNAPHFNNTHIVFEDAVKYTENKLPTEFKRLIADSKQRNIDILFMYHCWADTPLDVFRKGIDYIQLFKTEDLPLVRKNNLRMYDQIQAASNRIQNHKSRFYGEFIDTATN